MKPLPSLRTALRANGIFSTVAGIIVTATAGGLAEYMVVSAALVRVVGLGTAVVGVSILWQMRKKPLAQGFALAVIAADVSWVGGAVVVLAVPGSMANRWLLGAASSVVVVFAVFQSLAFISESRGHPRRLSTEVDIAASPAVVWEHLTDLSSFSEWNPFIIAATGRVETGARLDLRMRQPGGRTMRFRPLVTETLAPTRLEWLGSLLVPGLFDGRHRFELEETPAGTRLVQSEEFTGLLVPVLWRSLDSETRAGFEAMNAALMSQVEGPVRDSV